MENTQQTPHEKLDQFIKDNNIELKSKFIPFSFSRDAGKIDVEKEKDKLFRSVGLTLNWSVTLSGNNNKTTTEYSKGIGHMEYQWMSPFFKIKSLDNANLANSMILDAVEKGLSYNIKTIEQFQNTRLKVPTKDFPTPTVVDILQSMIVDASVLDHHTFESWSSEMGGNPDSRAEEKIYNKCKKTSAEFLKIVGGEDKLQTLREIMYDVENEPTPTKIKP